MAVYRMAFSVKQLAARLPSSRDRFEINGQRLDSTSRL
jgi:hypothetical protein